MAQKAWTTAEVVSLSHTERCRQVPAQIAKNLGFIVIDGASGPQFIGTQEEQNARISILAKMGQPGGNLLARFRTVA